MKTQKTILVAAVVLIVASLLVVASVLLVKGGRELTAAQSELDQRKLEYQAYFSKNPFPSRENVAIERQNRETLDKWFQDILAAASRRPMRAERSPSTFVRLLVETRDSLMDAARKCRMQEPPDPDRFSFGFDRYLGGSTLPAPDDVPTLTQQLLIEDGLIRLLLESGVRSLTAVTRDEFESAGRGARAGDAPQESVRVIRSLASSPSAGRSGDAGNRVAPIVTHPLYTRMSFGLRFTATEDALWNVLNAIARHDVFTVVTWMSAEKSGSDLRQLPADGSAAAQQGEPGSGEPPLRSLPRSQRQASGKELQAPLAVTIEVQTYLFKAE